MNCFLKFAGAVDPCEGKGMEALDDATCIIDVLESQANEWNEKIPLGDLVWRLQMLPFIMKKLTRAPDVMGMAKLLLEKIADLKFELVGGDRR